MWAQVTWGDCYTCKKTSGLRLVDPKEAMTTFLTNLMIHAVKPDNSYVQVMLRVCINATTTLYAKWGINFN